MVGVVQTPGGFWDAIVEFHKAANPGASSTAEPTIIVVGSENAGKSTLLSSFIYKTRPSDVRPTIGLDYKFIRTSSSSSSEGGVAQAAKTVHHFWEIGGGRPMSSTLSTLLTDLTAVLVVVDLSRPGGIVADLLYWLSHIRTAANGAGRLQPQVVVVANKYDALAAGINTDLLFRTIRAVAQRYDAAVMCHAVDQRHLHQQFRNGIARFLSQRPIVAGPLQADSSKPLAIPAGADSADAIGLPPGITTGSDTVKSWTQAFEKAFGSAGPLTAPVLDPDLEPEPSIDAAL